jgi:ABC-type branched-subunit amino acid transport system permease subunit
MNLFRKNSVVAIFLLGLLLAVIASFLPSYKLFLVGQLSIVIIVTVALTVLMGGAGLLALSSAAFMAVGAYGAVICVSTFNLPLLVAVPLVVVFGGIFGGVLGFITLRMSGFYLAIATLGLLQLVLVGLKHGGTLTGGGYGLVVPVLSIPFMPEITVERIASFSVLLMVLVLDGSRKIMRSRIGRAWLAVRDNEPAAQMQGINISQMKILAFIYSSAVISMAGALHGFLLGVTNPNAYMVNLSIFHITLVVVGGMTGSLVGAVISPIILYFLPEVFSALGEWRDFFYGLILLLSLVFMPMGISSKIQLLKARLLSRKRVQL